MNKVITKKCFLLFCVFLGWWSPSTSETLENRLIKNLEELFIIEGKKNLNPQDVGLVDDLLKHNVLTDLSGVISHTSYHMRDKSRKKGRDNEFTLIIWEFDNNDNAKRYLDVLVKFVYSTRRGYYEKPPRLFFVASNNLYEFITRYDMNAKYLDLAADKLINCCFSKSEVHLARDPYK